LPSVLKWKNFKPKAKAQPVLTAPRKKSRLSMCMVVPPLKVLFICCTLR
jgi:hypothetical protein